MEFFDLEHFAHKNLWQTDEPIWSPLHLLKKYLTDYPLGKIEVEIPSGVFLKDRGNVSIGEGTIIEPGVYIEGPCIIGKNCTIRHGAYLRANVILGDGCSVGHAAEVKHSILLDGAAATHFVYVGDSILGNRVNLGAGVKCANLRLDRSEVKVQKKGTGLKKFGAIIGDDVQIGCNCVLNPGTLIGRGSVCFPLLNIGGYLPPCSKIKHV